MEIRGIEYCKTVKSSVIASEYGLTVAEAKALKTCDQKIEIAEEMASKLIAAGLAEEFEYGGSHD